jgi:putative flippase GtrA
LLTKARHIILAIIDLFHKPFSRWIPAQTFRYLACGGSNTVLGIFLYHVAYNVVLRGQDMLIYNARITPAVGAWMIAFGICFPLGFALSRYVVFPESNLHGRIQLFRYALVTATFIVLNYALIKFFATFLYMIHPTISYAFVQVILAILSYISQRKFTFKTVEVPMEEEVAMQD